MKEDKTERDNILYRVTDKNWATVLPGGLSYFSIKSNPISLNETLCIFSKQVVFSIEEFRHYLLMYYNFQKIVRKKPDETVNQAQSAGEKKMDDVRHYCKDWRERFTFICGIFLFFFEGGTPPTGGALYAHPNEKGNSHFFILFVLFLFLKSEYAMHTAETIESTFCLKKKKKTSFHICWPFWWRKAKTKSKVFWKLAKAIENSSGCWWFETLKKK